MINTIPLRKKTTTKKLFFISAIISIFSNFIVPNAFAELPPKCYRQWESKDGTSVICAEVRGVTKHKVKLHTKDGRMVYVKKSKKKGVSP